MSQMIFFEPAIAVSMSIYASGDVIGTGNPYKIPNLLRVSGRGALLQKLVVRDAANQQAPLDMMFFSENPGASTLTDNAPLVIASADQGKYIGKIEVAASDYNLLDATFAEATLKQLGFTITKSADTDIYLIMVTRGTPTFAAATDLSIIFDVMMGDR